MNYTIFSIDDSRKDYTDAIRAQLTGFWWDEKSTDCVNGYDKDAVEEALHTHNINVHARLKPGQLGVYLTVLNALRSWGAGPLVTFEDDAVLHNKFNSIFWVITSNLPKDADAFALFLPRDQDVVYHGNPQLAAPGVCRAYQRYGGVSMLWTPSGAARFLERIRKDGITGQWDDQLFEYNRAGLMNVYTQPPVGEILVRIVPGERSLVQEGEYL